MNRQWIWKIGLTLGSVFGAGLLDAIADPVFDPAPLIPFFAAIAVSSWYGGRIGGLLAVALSLPIAFGSPTNATLLAGGDPFIVLARVVSFAATAAASIWLLTSYRVALRHVATLTAARDEALANAEAERRFRGLTEASPDALAIVDDRGRINLINSQTEALFGYDRSELIGKPMEVLLPQRLRQGHAKFRSAYSKDPRVRPMGGGLVLAARHRDGHEIPVEISLSPLETASGRLIIASVRDVTKRTEAERRLAESEKRYRHLVESIGEMVYRAALSPDDLDYFHVEFLNGAVGKLLGFSPDDFGRDPQLWSSLVHPEDLQPMQALDRKHRPSGQPYVRVYRVRNGQTGEYHWIEDSVSFVLDEAGQAIARQGVARDITERHRIQQKLEASEEQNRRLIDGIDAIVWEADGPSLDDDSSPARRYTFVSNYAVALLGFPIADWLDDPDFWVRTIHPADRDKFVEACREDTGGRANSRLEYRAVAADGRLVWLRDIFRAVEGPTGAHTKLFGVTVDITDRKSIEEQLQQARKLEALGQLAGGIAHDFNNLLTVIAGHASLLEARLDQDSPFRLNVEELVAATEQAALLTQQLLAFSRRRPVQLTALDVNEVVNDMGRMLRYLLGENIEIECRLSTDPVVVEADLSQLQQLVLNLAVNSRDAMPSGGRFTIETGRVDLQCDHGRDRLGLPFERAVCLSIMDNGAGMTAETKSRLFEPFFTTKDVGKGTGLGLATVYGIVQQWGGQIEITSEPGKGARFDIYLPGSHKPLGKLLELSSSASAETGPWKRATILLVDDDDKVRRVARSILENDGYRVVEAHTSEHALDLIAERGTLPNLLLTDIVMPGLDGWELGRRIEELVPAVRVLYMSGYAQRAGATRGFDEAPNLIDKPFTRQSLIRTSTRLKPFFGRFRA